MAKYTAAALAVKALEQVGARFTFGIPGVHNTELYDELGKSTLIEPILVTSEFSGSFMAEAMSRIGGSLGCLALVPAAGLTHAASGIGEAMLDGIPLLVITGGVRTDLPYRYQLHQIDQLEVARGLTKGAFRVERHDEVMPCIFAAARLALSGTPGPVLVELPVNLQITPAALAALPDWQPPSPPPLPDEALLDAAVQKLTSACRPALFVGWGARGADLVALAERLQAPVATSLQGLASFPHDHPLHAGFSFGPSAVPAAREALADHDCLLAIGVRFGEIATGSFGIPTPRQLIHIDIDADVIGANYPADIGLVGDAPAIVAALLSRLPARPPRTEVSERIARLKAQFQDRSASPHKRGRVNPARFLARLRAHTAADALMVLDDGNHTFLAAEHWSVLAGGDLISPTDFNAMGYAVPAAIAGKLAHPARDVVCIVGDGCLRMSGLELATARARRLGVLCCVFNDGELSQIAQAQAVPYNRKVCTQLPALDLNGLALATGCAYRRLQEDEDIESVLRDALALARRGEPVLLDIRVDYSRPTAFSVGTLKTNLKRLETPVKSRMLGRALWRRVTG